MKKHLILASNSPRRKEILLAAGFHFTVKTAEADESTRERNPEKLVMELSLRKANALYNTLTGEEKRANVVLGADTIVAGPDGSIMGKPSDREAARRMLRGLSGKTHSVYTGVALLFEEESGAFKAVNFAKKSLVTFYPMSEAEIEDYVSSGECDDKAGAYAIQGLSMRFIESLNGDYHNVVGLPAGEVYQQLKNNDITII